jgi:hypothetical protein
MENEKSPNLRKTREMNKSSPWAWLDDIKHPLPDNGQVGGKISP